MEKNISIKGLRIFRRASGMLRSGAAMQAVIEAFSGQYTEEELNRGIAAYRARKRVYNSYDGPSPTKLGLLCKPGRKAPAISREIDAVRQRRLSFVHPTIIGRLAGDPPPELSGLHQPSSPRIVPDSLDYLISPFRNERQAALD
jgi:hypothetical protein